MQDDVNKYMKLAKNERDYEIEIRKLNDLLMLTERAFIDFNGLPNRPFFRHIVYGTKNNSENFYLLFIMVLIIFLIYLAPSQYDSYFGQAFPTISDAIFVSDQDSLIWALKYDSLFIDGASNFLCYQNNDF